MSQEITIPEPEPLLADDLMKIVGELTGCAIDILTLTDCGQHLRDAERPAVFLMPNGANRPPELILMGVSGPAGDQRVIGQLTFDRIVLN